jgi:hypothetical protein
MSAQGSIPRHFTGTLYRSTQSRPFGATTILGLLVRGMADGDRDALARLHSALARDMLAAVIGAGVDRPVAEEMVASAFVEIWQCATQHTGGGAADWIATIVYRRCFDLQHGTPVPAAEESLPGAIAAARGRSDGMILAGLLNRSDGTGPTGSTVHPSGAIAA